MPKETVTNDRRPSGQLAVGNKGGPDRKNIPAYVVAVSRPKDGEHDENVFRKAVVAR